MIYSLHFIVYPRSAHWLKTVNPSHPIITKYGIVKIHANLLFLSFTANAEARKKKGKAYILYLNLGVEPKYQVIGAAKIAPKIISQILFV